MKWLRAKQSGRRWPTIAAPADGVQPPLFIRLMWMVGIWAASVTVLLVIAYALRWVLVPAR